MKKTLFITIASLVILSISIMLTSCGNNPSAEATTVSKDSVTTTPVSEPTVQKDGTFCFEYKDKKVKGVYSVLLTIKGDSITGGYDNVENGGNGSGGYEGYRKGDTLFLSETFEDATGEIEKLGETIWLLQGDNLFQYETIKKKGHVILKNPLKPAYISTYNKKNCK